MPDERLCPAGRLELWFVALKHPIQRSGRAVGVEAPARVETNLAADLPAVTDSPIHRHTRCIEERPGTTTRRAFRLRANPPFPDTAKTFQCDKHVLYAPFRDR